MNCWSSCWVLWKGLALSAGKAKMCTEFCKQKQTNKNTKKKRALSAVRLRFALSSVASLVSVQVRTNYAQSSRTWRLLWCRWRWNPVTMMRTRSVPHWAVSPLSGSPQGTMFPWLAGLACVWWVTDPHGDWFWCNSLLEESHFVWGLVNSHFLPPPPPPPPLFSLSLKRDNSHASIQQYNRHVFLFITAGQ